MNGPTLPDRRSVPYRFPVPTVDDIKNPELPDPAAVGTVAAVVPPERSYRQRVQSSTFRLLTLRAAVPPERPYRQRVQSSTFRLLTRRTVAPSIATLSPNSN